MFSNNRAAPRQSEEYSLHSYTGHFPWGEYTEHEQPQIFYRPKGAARSLFAELTNNQKYGTETGSTDFRRISESNFHMQNKIVDKQLYWMPPELDSFQENKHGFRNSQINNNEPYNFQNHRLASMEIGIGEGHSRKPQESFFEKMEPLKSFENVPKPAIQINSAGANPPYADIFDFDCDSFWESSRPERMEETTTIFSSLENVPGFQARDNCRQFSRTTSSSASISDEELEKIYESYRSRSTVGCEPLIEERPTQKPNEYLTPKKKKGTIHQEQRVEENRSCNQQHIHSNGKKQKDKYCRFCRSNGEMVEFYTTHKLKDEQGHVICPILSNYVCPNCYATGSKAHTKKHCPLYQPKTSSAIRKGCVTRRNAAGHIIVSRV